MPTKIKTFDVIIFLIPLLLLILSITVIYSLVFGTSDINLVYKQATSSGIGLALMAIASFVDYRFFRGVNWIFYIISLLLLVYVDFFGVAAGGAMRWIDLGFFQLQPSEVAKLFIIITLASFFSSRIGSISWKSLLLSFLIMVPPLLLILKEPDLGTALVVCFIYIGMLYFSRPNRLQTIVITLIILLGFAFLIASAVGIKPFDKILKDYQRNRILTFIDPNLDPYGKGYNVRQAQITVGSGGIFGKGLGKGSQSQLQFLPKAHTDFIFAGIAESFGFLGATIMVVLFSLLIIKIINVAFLAQDNFGMLICFGAAMMFLFQVIINVGMNLGLAPVTGIPLPFSSYGGSALIVYLFLIGLIESILARHKKINF